MPNTREKLIDLRQEGEKIAYDFCVSRQECENCPYHAPNGCQEGMIADHLIANGVTVQKWIPVTERLPEEYTTVLVCGEDGVEPGRFYGKSGFWTYDQYEQDPIFAVTHWMPLPEPPKGE